MPFYAKLKTQTKFIDGVSESDIIELGGGGMIDNRKASGLRKSPFIELTDEETVFGGGE